MMTEVKNCMVVLIHGIGGHWLLMKPLEWHLQQAGFNTETIGYRSWLGSIQQHAKQLKICLETLQNDPKIDAIHIVSHSMGSILVRQVLLHHDFEKLQRIVMLSPPNHGSLAARLLSILPPFCFSKTLKQISNHKNSFVRTLPQPTGDHQIGIIMASYDLVVPSKSSHLEYEQDHTTIFSGHNGLLVRPNSARKTIEFLKHGCFERA